MIQVSVKYVHKNGLWELPCADYIPVIELSGLRAVVEGLKWESGRKKCANADELNIALGYRYAMEDLLAQFEAHTKGEIKQ